MTEVGVVCRKGITKKTPGMVEESHQEIGIHTSKLDKIDIENTNRIGEEILLSLTVIETEMLNMSNTQTDPRLQISSLKRKRLQEKDTIHHHHPHQETVILLVAQTTKENQQEDKDMIPLVTVISLLICSIVLYHRLFL